MLFICVMSTGERLLNYTQTVICDICGRYGRYQVIMTYMYFSFFFIPLFKWNKRFYVKMTCCDTVYELDPEVGREILAGRQAEITPKDLTLCRKGNAFGSSWQDTSGSAADRPAGEQSRRRCSQCGYETEEDFNFCPKCGKKLE